MYIQPNYHVRVILPYCMCGIPESCGVSGTVICRLRLNSY